LHKKSTNSAILDPVMVHTPERSPSLLSSEGFPSPELGIVERPNNRSVTFAPLSPTSSRRLSRIKSKGVTQAYSDSTSSTDQPRLRRRNSEPLSNRPNTPSVHRRRHRRPSLSPSPSSSSAEDIEVLPDRFDAYGRPIESTYRSRSRSRSRGPGNRHGDDDFPSGQTEMVERFVRDFSNVVDGRGSWKDLLRPLFESGRR
jgi:hypothetical protein